jgi:hypothetical protein
MLIFIFLAGMCTGFLLIDIMKKYLLLRTFILSEKQLLMLSMSLIEFKYQAINMVNIVYERLAEENPSNIEEQKLIIEKIHQKFNLFGDAWINNLKNYLPYNTEYNNWQQAIEHVQKLITKNRD